MKLINIPNTLLVVITATAVLFSCEEFTNINPPRNEVVGDAVFSSDAAVQSAISGIYSLMMAAPGFANSAVEQYSGWSSDEITSYSSNVFDREFFFNSLNASNTTLQSMFWEEPYKLIFNANTIIEGLDSNDKISAKVKSQVLGEARFIRAYCYFYLTNLFGPVPLVTTTDYRVNASLARSSPSIVYQQIIEDLRFAQENLPVDFVFANSERVRPTRWAAAALLARTYLYTGAWAIAEEAATTVISNTAMFTLVADPKNVFLKNSTESIWQLKPVVSNANTRLANAFILDAVPNGVSWKNALSDAMMNSFEPGDARRTSWVGSFSGGGKTYYYPFKYKKRGEALTEYSTVLRLSEQYLIRSEARAQLSDITGSLADLNVIRKRATLANRITTDKVVLLSFIEQERMVELFAEGGHRWFDLKRTGRASAILQTVKTNWSDSDLLYPIPQAELLLNPNLAPQNPGY